MFVAVTRIQHGNSSDVHEFEPGETLPNGVFTDKDLEALLSVGAIAGDNSGYTTEGAEEPTVVDEEDEEDEEDGK